MICPNSNCKHEIPENSSFCPDCGTAVTATDFVPESIRHLGHLDLIPTGMEKWQLSEEASLFIFYLFIGLIGCVTINIYGLTEEIPAVYYLGLVMSIICITIIIILSPIGKKKLSDIADYIEKYTVNDITKKENKNYVIEREGQNYAIFVKDGKCGVLNVRRYKVSAEARYTSLAWRDKDKYLIATRDGKTMVIDVKGRIYQ